MKTFVYEYWEVTDTSAETFPRPENENEVFHALHFGERWPMADEKTLSQINNVWGFT